MSHSEPSYAADRRTALEHQYRFTVFRKEERGGRWQHVHEDIPDLHEAMTAAQGIDAYEVGVFVEGRFLYWTSAHPDLLNSTVIGKHHEIVRED